MGVEYIKDLDGLAIVDGEVVPPGDVQWRENQDEDVLPARRVDVMPPATILPPRPEGPVPPVEAEPAVPGSEHSEQYHKAWAAIQKAIEAAREHNEPAIHITVDRYNPQLGREVSTTYHSVAEYLLAHGQDFASTDEYNDLLARGNAAAEAYEAERTRREDVPNPLHPVRRVWNNDTGDFDEEEY